MAVNVRDSIGKLLFKLPDNHPIAAAHLHTEYGLNDRVYVIVGRARRNTHFEINVMLKEHYNDRLRTDTPHP